MAAKGARHEWVRTRLANVWMRGLSEAVELHVETGWRPGGPVYLEPDLMIAPAGLQPAYVAPPVVQLIEEVGDTRLGYDRTTKALVYARLGVREYWSIDANTLQTMRFRRPTETGYVEAQQVAPTELLQPEFAPV